MHRFGDRDFKMFVEWMNVEGEINFHVGSECETLFKPITTTNINFGTW